MGSSGWSIEKEDAQREYDANSISRETYDRRTKFAIGMIYKCGDKDTAERMARAHGYKINELIEFVDEKDF